MKKRLFLSIVFVLLGGVGSALKAQQVAVKTNLVSDALLNVNLGVEVALEKKWTLDLTGDFNGWTLSHDRRWKHWLAQPEVRYWFCDRFGGHFVGAHILGGQYNIGGFNGRWNLLGTDARKLSETRYQGWFAGAGIVYGYAWPVRKHFNIEAVVGLGWTYTRYEQFRCAGCGKKIDSNHPHNFVGPTKLAVNLVYVF